MVIENLEEMKVFWHSTSHVLAQAVKRLYPQVKLTIGPAIDNGFYYDFDSDVAFTPEILNQIEAEMKKITKENLKIERFVLPREEALELMKNEPYKDRTHQRTSRRRRDQLLQTGRIRRPLRRSSPQLCFQDQSIQTHTVHRCLLERRCFKENAPENLRYLFPQSI